MATSTFANDGPPAGHGHRAVGTRPATGDLLAGVRHAIGQLTGALTTAVQADWHSPAGSLDWSVRRTVDHLVDVCC